MNGWKSNVDQQIAAQGRAIMALESSYTQMGIVLAKVSEHVDKTTSILDKIQGGWSLFKWVISILLTLIALEIGLSHAGKLAEVGQNVQRNVHHQVQAMFGTPRAGLEQPNAEIILGQSQ